MTDVLIIAGLILSGWVLGYIYEQLVKKGEDIKLKSFEAGGSAPSLATFLAETFYFSALFSVPLSGNIPLTGIILALFLYVLFGSFGGGPKGKKINEEDMVVSKWHRTFP